MKTLKIVTLWFSLILVAVSSCTPKNKTHPAVGLELITDGLTSPVALILANDGSHRLFVVDQTGLIWILSEGRRLETPFLDLRRRVVELHSFYDERGLLGLAFHPDFVTNGRFYVSYSAPLRAGLSPTEWDHTTYISEFTVSADD